MWSLILVSMRADSIPFAWDGFVTSILLNLQKSGHPSNEIAVADDGIQHWSGTVVACIAFEGSGTVGGFPSLDESELGDSPKVHPLMQRHTNSDLGHPSTVLRWS